MDAPLAVLSTALDGAVMVLDTLSIAAGGPGWLTLYTLIGAIIYAAACRIWPYASCGNCEGKGKFRSPSGKHWRNCRRCKGSGRKIRFGAWLMGRLSKELKL